MHKMIIGIALVMTLVACSGGGSSDKTRFPNATIQTPPTPSSRTALPTTTPSPTIDPKDVAEIESTARRYFEADNAIYYGTLISTSTSELHRYWTLQQLVYGSQQDPGTSVSVDFVKVTEIEGDQATADLKASITGRNVNLSFTGPLIMRRVGGAWKVVTYSRNGVPTTDTIFTTVKGSGNSNGVTVKPLMVHSTQVYTEAVVRIENNSGGTIDYNYTPTFIDERGQQYDTNGNMSSSSPLFNKGSAVVAFWVDVLLLKNKPKSLRLVLKMAAEQTFDTWTVTVPMKLIA